MTEHAMGRVVAAMGLVAGTCIGGGMLALPVASAGAGFVPSIIIMAVCCVFMTITGLLFVEATLWFEEGAHLVTITSKLLGPIGRIVTILLFLFIGYASLVAYTEAVGDMLVSGINLGTWGAGLATVLVFGVIIALGQRVIGPVNTVLFVALLVAYVLLIGGGVLEVKMERLQRSNWGVSLMSLPIMLTIFSYQAVVPSLVRYLHRDAKRLRLALIGGCVLAFVVYALWQWLILGIVPYEGLGGLEEALAKGVGVSNPLQLYASSRWVAVVGALFAFFALVTSFIGVGMGLFDFIADGLHIERSPWGRTLLGAMVILPTFFITGLFPNLFIVALDLTGGFGDAILNGVIPVALVYSGRHIKHFREGLRMPGGRLLLAAVVIFALFVFAVEVYERTRYDAPIEDLR
jgi:tyrosine-specific transport protein